MPKKAIIPQVPGIDVGKKETATPAEAQGFPKIEPTWWTGSLAEYYCTLALDRLHAIYDYEKTKLGAVAELGSVQIDILVYEPIYLAIRIQGEYWHYQQGAGQIARDLLQKLKLESRGIPVIDIDEDNILYNPMWYVTEALNLRDHSRAMRQGF